MNNLRELYDRVKQDPNAIVMDVGEKHPLIIHEAHAHVTYKDGTQGEKVVYAAFEYVKKHLKELKAGECEACRDAVIAYQINKKAMRGEDVKALIPDSWMLEQ